MAADPKDKEKKDREQHEEQELRDEQLKGIAGGTSDPLGAQLPETSPGTGSGPQVSDSPQ